tara:strand:+ start:287 stop:961 length:675 start_codon:yes stop_codon:yes gene_type:complete
MISWLKGKIIQIWQLSSKKGVVLDVGGIGYEIQLLPKQIDIVDNSNLKEFWIHQINREDCTNLYGFNEIDQRDLFKKIISVNGIGPQIAMVLLEDLEVYKLVNAIEECDLNLLTKSQGIGKRIAERLVIELKNKLQQFKHIKENNIDCKETNTSDHLSKYLEEIKSILISLGYMESEIKDSIKITITNKKENILILNSLSGEAKNELMDKHLKEILIRLSQKST